MSLKNSFTFIYVACILTASCQSVKTPHKEKTSPTDLLEESSFQEMIFQKTKSFKTSFSKPKIDKITDSPIKLIKWITVIDQKKSSTPSEGSSLWLETQNQKKFKHPEQISQALKSILFNPKTQKDCYPAILLFFYGLYHTPELLTDAYLEGLKNKIDTSRFKTGIRLINQTQTAWTFRVLAYDRSPRFSFPGQKDSWNLIDEYEFIIGKNTYKVSKRNLWSSKELDT